MSKEKLDDKVEMVKSQKLIELEAKYGVGKIKEVTLSNQKGESVDVYLKLPDRIALSNYMVWNDKDYNKCNTLVISRCLIKENEHFDKVNTDDEFFTACGMAIASLMPIGTYEIKN